MSLTPDQIRKLQSAGVSPTVIASYQRGNLNPITGMGMKIKNILSGGISPSIGSSATPSNLFSQTFNKKYPSTPQPTSRVSSAGILPLGATGGTGSYGTPRAPVAIPNNWPTIAQTSSPGYHPILGAGRVTPPTSNGVPYKTPSVTYNGPSTPGAFGPGIPNRQGGDKTDAERDAEDAALDRVTPTRTAERKEMDLPPIGPAPGAPVYPELSLPDLIVRDFLDPAKQQFAEAYAPLYQALEQGKTNATQNQQRSDQVLQGLYAGLASDIGAQGQAQAGQYAQSGQQAQATAQALQDKIGEIYNAGNSQEANLAASLGQGAAGAEAIAGNAGERQFQQAEAATQGAAQQNSYQQGGQAAQDYATNMGNAARTEGAGRRSDLVAQLGNILSGFDTQGLQYKSEEARGAIGQANVLSERDMSQQQAHINELLQMAGITDNRINSQSAAARQAYDDQINQRNAELARLDATKAADAAALQQKIDNNFKARELARLEAGSGGASSYDGYGNPIPEGATGPKADGPTQVRQTAAAILRSKGDSSDPADYEALIKSIQYDDVNDPNLPTAALGGKNDGSSKKWFDKNTFINEARRKASDKGKDPEVAAAVADKYYDVYASGN